MRKLALPLIFVAALGLAGCSGMNDTQQKTLSGGAIGAGAGAAGSALTGGSPAGGAILGGAVGAGAGYLMGESENDD